MTDGPRLLSVHAHPDDEASKGAPTVAKYAAAGAATTLVCCTGGEAGDILNPAMDRPEVRSNLAQVRRDELSRSASIIGFGQVEMLGYHDSGMPDSEDNARPDNFWNAPIDESTGRLVEIIRRTRPHVMLTYGDEQGHYPHPDHLRVHDISVLAFERAADPSWYPEAGDPWQPQKMYYSVWSMGRVRATHDAMLRLGMESPFDERWLSREDHDHRITTRIPVADFHHVRREALLAHATQIDPASPFWFGLPPDESERIHSHEDFVLGRDLTGSPIPEDDLFAGVDLILASRAGGPAR